MELKLNELEPWCVLKKGKQGSQAYFPEEKIDDDGKRRKKATGKYIFGT